MTEKEDKEVQAGGTRARTIVFGGFAVLVAAAIGAVIFAQNYVSQEREIALRNWQIRLGIVADSRSAAIQAYLDRQFAAMQSLAENASLQIYLTELQLMREAGEISEEGEAVEGEFLSNLLQVSAQQAGFVPQVTTEVNANVARTGSAGIVLTDDQGTALAATPNMPPLSERYRKAMLQAAEGEPALVDIFMAPSGPSIGFVVPVYAIQADKSSSANIGYVIGQKVIGEDLFGELEQPGDIAKSTETILVRTSKNSITYVSPLADGTKPLKRSMDISTPNLAAAFAANKSGGFAEMQNYKGENVLVTGRQLSAAPWHVVRMISVEEAMAETESRLQFIMTVLIGMIVIIGVVIIAVWRHGTSVRSAKAIEEFKIAKERHQNYAKFLQVVTDGHPAKIMAVDEAGHYTFVNKWTAEGTGLSKEELVGKSMLSVVGPTETRQIQEVHDHVFKNFEPESKILTFDRDEGEKQVVQSYHLPLKGDRDFPPAILTILQDITDVVDERQKRENTMRKLVTTLVSLVDQRDPYSANQSQRVAEVGVAIAKEMQLPEEIVRTVDLAGNLMNLGKVLVPTSVLTKVGKLSEDELNQVRESLLKSADLLEGLEFDVPVAAAVRDLQECWDGSGYPHGKTGEDIHIAARIISVANAFVGMVSPRAYRDALAFTKSVSFLLEDSEKIYDRKPVSALLNYLENRDGSTEWAHFQEKPEG